jgi:dUTP pyrophosphatase
MQVEIMRMSNHALPLPERATFGAAGQDLRASHHAVIPPGKHGIVRTGFAMAIPDGFVGMVCPRSGLAARHGVTVLNAPGIVDSDYRGEVGVILINLGSEQFQVAPGDRVAQLVLAHYRPADFLEVVALDATERGQGAYGSTGT